MALFATDSMDANDHVWVTLYQVTLVSASGSQTVFEDANGVQLDLKTLRDIQGAKFGFLGVGNVTGGPFNSAEVVLSKSLTVFASGAGTGVEKTFADSLDEGPGKSKLVLPFARPLPLGAGDKELVIDFDLANWDDVADKVTPVLKEHNGQGLDDDRRHVEHEHEGTVSGLSGAAPAHEFNLVTGGGRTIRVRTNADTVVYSNGHKTNPTLANGVRVHVRGRFKLTADILLATSVKVQNDDSHDDGDEAQGPVSNINETAGTFDLKVTWASGFIPKATTIHIVTDANTVFRGRRGVQVTKAEFFAALASNGFAEVEGVYNEESGTLTASRCKVGDDGGGGGGGGGQDDVEGRGSVSNVNEGAGTFTLTLSEWEGFSGSVGLELNVVTTSGTKFFNKNREIVDKSAFFAELAQFGFAEVEGHFSGGTFTASKAKIEDD